MTTTTTARRVGVLINRELLRAAPDTVERAAKAHGVPAWVKPRACDHGHSPSVYYTWEWSDEQS